MNAAHGHLGNSDFCGPQRRCDGDGQPYIANSAEVIPLREGTAEVGSKSTAAYGPTTDIIAGAEAIEEQFPGMPVSRI
jgi:hypothetical protein